MDPKMIHGPTVTAFIFDGWHPVLMWQKHMQGCSISAMNSNDCLNSSSHPGEGNLDQVVHACSWSWRDDAMRCRGNMILQGLGMPRGRWKQRPLWRWIVSGNPKVKVCNHSLPSRSVYNMKLAIPNILKKQHFGAYHQVIPQTEPLQHAKKQTEMV